MGTSVLEKHTASVLRVCKGPHFVVLSGDPSGSLCRVRQKHLGVEISLLRNTKQNQNGQSFIWK